MTTLLASAPPTTVEQLRFVALGDSITVGLGDGISMGARGSAGGASDLMAGRGWAARLAPCLGAAGTPQAAFTNLATTGARLRDLRGAQLPLALAEQPHVASVIAGMNDLIRDDFAPGQAVADLAECVHALRATGAVVLLMTIHDPFVLVWVPRAISRPVRERIAVLNDTIRALAWADEGVLLLELPDDAACYALEGWDVDRVHPGPAGHARIASRFATLLGQRGIPIRREPEPVVAARSPSRAAHLWWLATRGLPWLVLRSRGVIGGLGDILRRGRSAG